MKRRIAVRPSTTTKSARRSPVKRITAKSWHPADDMGAREICNDSVLSMSGDDFGFSSPTGAASGDVLDLNREFTDLSAHRAAS